MKTLWRKLEKDKEGEEQRTRSPCLESLKRENKISTVPIYNAKSETLTDNKMQIQSDGVVYTNHWKGSDL